MLPCAFVDGFGCFDFVGGTSLRFSVRGFGAVGL